MTRRNLIITAALLWVVIAGVVGAVLYDRRNARLAFADTSRCLLGPEGATSQNVAARYRRHRLTLPNGGNPDQHDWPRNCLPYAKRLRDSASSALLSWSSGEVYRVFDGVVSMLEPSAHDGAHRQGAPLVAAWALAERQGLTGGVSNVAGPPPSAELLTLDDLALSLVAQQQDALLGVSGRGFFGAARPGFATAHHYCWVGERLDCVRHPYEPHHQVPLVGVANTTNVGRGPLFAAQNQIFLAENQEQPIASSRMFEGSPASSWVGPNELAVIVTAAEDGRPAIRIHSRGRIDTVDFDRDVLALFEDDPPQRAAALGRVRVAFGQLYFLGTRRDATQLYSIRIRDDGSLGEPTELATVTTPSTGWQVDIAACRPADDQGIVIVSLADETWVVFREDGRPTVAVHSGAMGGVYRLRGCSRGRVLLDHGRPMECTPEGCRQREAYAVEPPGGAARGPRFVTAEALLGDNMLVVWGGRPGSDDGVSMKLAPGSELSDAPARLILDDAVEAGSVLGAGRVRDLKLFGGTSEALLIVLLDDGRELALRIEADGSVRSEQVRFTGP